jgi:hypothetical protein
VSMDEWIDMYSMGHPDWSIAQPGTGWGSDTGYNMGGTLNTMLSESARHKKTPQCMTPLIRNIQNRWNQRQEVESWIQRLEVESQVLRVPMSCLLMGMGLSFGVFARQVLYYLTCSASPKILNWL